MTPTGRVRFSAAVCADHGLSAAAKIVGVVLVTRFLERRFGDCTPLHAEISYATGLRRRAVSTAIRELRTAGWINVWRAGSRGRPTVYWPTIAEARL